ncbi:helix-turn-helix transcriptional regulator [Mycobacteroides abscessus]|uniref:helix-turn-helix transcriptional regulator n=1 Tax=Mycobacteroides abscessus TaxID=36809 RepID=UPI000926BDDD|nr:hypothetical protein [Mycobacteroides abscessus]SIC32973.1 helix-turn-helix domain protein [Mycobacteroides abscessus subsp. bolletii]SKT26558.1 helix-turn-helix domain protein [Mycobacteroides abscessus subsp. bolletii]
MTEPLALVSPSSAIPPRRNLVSTRVAAQLVGKTEETLRRWHRSTTYDGPRPFRIGGELRWDADEIRAYVETCRT